MAQLNLADGMPRGDFRTYINANFAELYTAVAAFAGVTGVTPTYKFAINTSDQINSLMHAATGMFAAGDLVFVRFYDLNLDAESGGLLRVSAVNGSPYGGTLGTLTNGGASGLILEGLNYRFAIVPTAGGEIDLRRMGIRCVEGVTGWHSRFNTACAFFKNQLRLAMTGSGVLSCTETVYLDRVYGDLSRLRFQGGTHVPDGATVGVGTFFTAAQENLKVSITPGSPVVVTLANHGFTADKQIAFGTTGRLPGGITTFNASNAADLMRYYVIPVDTNTFQIATTSGGAAINSATAGNGTHWLFHSPGSQSLPAQSNITTQDWMLWNGKIKRLGIVVRAGTNGSNKDWMEQMLQVWGDGNSTWNTRPTTLNIRHESDDSPNGYYRYSSSYGYALCAIQGPAEKHKVHVAGTYGGFGIIVPAGGSADTIEIDSHLSNCCVYYAEHHGVNTTIKVNLHNEGHDDPAVRINWDGGKDHPAHLVRNGKATTLTGMVRTMNGLNSLWVDGLLNESGASNRYGCDFFQMGAVRWVHGYGRFVFKAVRHLAGPIDIKNWSNPNGPLAQNTHCVHLGRIADAGEVHGTITDCANSGGLKVGSDGGTFVYDDAQDLYVGDPLGGYYPYGTMLGNWAIAMGASSPLSFNPDSPDGTPGTERSGSSGFPTTLTASTIEKMKGGQVTFTDHKGNMFIGAAVTDTATLVVPRETRRYTITKHASAVVDVGYPTLATAGLTIV